MKFQFQQDSPSKSKGKVLAVTESEISAYSLQRRSQVAVFSARGLINIELYGRVIDRITSASS